MIQTITIYLQIDLKQQKQKASREAVIKSTNVIQILSL